MQYCVQILLTKNALVHVHHEDEFVKNQLHKAGRLTRLECISMLKVVQMLILYNSILIWNTCFLH